MKTNRLPQSFAFLISLLLVTVVVLSGCGAWISPSGIPDEVLDVNRVWTTVGSDGTVDEDDAGKVSFDRGRVQVGNFIDHNQDIAAFISQPDSAVIRYNVTPVDGLFSLRGPCQEDGTECPGLGLEVRYRALGPDTQVVVKLIEVNVTTGIELERLTLDSKDFPGADDYQVQRVGECFEQIPPWLFDFRHKAYYIEATLSHSSIVAASGAGIQTIKIVNDCQSSDVILNEK